MEVGSFATLLNRLDRGGALQARKMASGAVQFYWRYTLDGSTSREPIGIFDPIAPPKKLEPTARGYSLAAALEKCRELGLQHEARLLTGGLRALKAEVRQTYVKSKAAEAEKATLTLQKLLEVYVGYLRSKAGAATSTPLKFFQRHVFAAYPAVAELPVPDITAEHIPDMQRRLVGAAKGRSANKLRSYLRAAYQCAQDVRSMVSTPVAFKPFRILDNPAAQTRRLSQFDRADKRPFSVDEMRRYWQLIANMPGFEGAFLRFHVLTGGQRIEQLVRLKVADIRRYAIVLMDGKGRSGQGPRVHRVPLLAQARADIALLPKFGEYAISTTRGAQPISVRTMAGWALQRLAGRIEGFQLKRVRSGVETLLASKGVNRGIRGHLQSHGLSGVQARHYGGHDYMKEKLAALEMVLAELEAGDVG